MGTSYNPKVVTDGLVLCLDAANPKSKSYNILSNPENLSGLISLRSGASISPNHGIAPDGTQTADLITATGSGFGYYFPAWPTGNATHSYFLKPVGSSTAFTFSHVGTGMGGTFNFSTKTFSSMNTYTGSYTELSNGWFLVNFHTTSETNNYYVEVSFNNNNGGYIWGAQLTPFNTYKTYIPQSSGMGSITNTLNLVDLSGNSFNGTLVNGVGFSGFGAGSLVFDGSNDYVNLPYSILSGTGDFTINVWIKSSSTGYGGVFANYPAGNLEILYGQSYIGLWLGNNSTYISSPGTEYTTNPVFLTAMRTGGSETRFYINTILKKTGASTASIGSVSNFRIGTNTNGTEAFPGSVSYIQAYNRAITQDEIVQNFNSTRGRFGV